MKPLPSNKLPLSISLLFFLLLAVGCSSTDTVVTTVYPRVVYSYGSLESEPAVCLSLYGEVLGQPWRIEKLTVQHVESGMTWQTSDIACVSGKNEDTQYVGYGSFMTLEKTFRPGVYTATWTQKNGVSTIVEFTLAPQNPSLPQTADSVTTVMVEDGIGTVLFAGQWDGNFTSPASILKTYPDAVLYRKYVLKTNPRVLYTYPPEYLRNTSDHEY